MSAAPARTSIVVMTRNRADEVAASVTLLRELRPVPPIIVVDNGSQDDTVARLHGTPGVEVIALTHNHGAVARNTGVEVARTPFVAFADDDSWWAPDALPRAERVFDAYPGVGLVAARTLVGAQARLDPTSAAMASSPLGSSADLPGPAVLGFLACSAVVRREAFLEAGGFSEILHFAGEEELLAYDLATHGWALCYVDTVIAHHHPSALRPPSDERIRRELRNTTLVSWMRRPRRKVLGATAELIRRSLVNPRERAAIGAFARKLPAALRERRELPPEVENQIRRLEESR